MEVTQWLRLYDDGLKTDLLLGEFYLIFFHSIVHEHSSIYGATVRHCIFMSSVSNLVQSNTLLIYAYVYNEIYLQDSSTGTSFFSSFKWN